MGLVLLFLAGCMFPRYDPLEWHAVQEPIACADEIECARLWQRAVAWVARNSRMPIRVQTAELVETEREEWGSRRLWYRVLREMRPDGSGRIQIHAECLTTLRCEDDPVAQMADFRTYVLD